MSCRYPSDRPSAGGRNKTGSPHGTNKELRPHRASSPGGGHVEKKQQGQETHCACEDTLSFLVFLAVVVKYMLY